MALEPCTRVPKEFEPLADADRSPITVGQMLLPGMAAYARVFNPARTASGGAIRWDELGLVRSTTQWVDIANDNALVREGVREPSTGTVDPLVAQRLSHLLGVSTPPAAFCYFLVWEGYADLRNDLAEAATIDLPPHRRRMHILSGKVIDAVEPVDRQALRLPMWWLPENRSWCVGNDIYGRSVFVAGDMRTIRSIVADPNLEAHFVDPEELVLTEDF